MKLLHAALVQLTEGMDVANVVLLDGRPHRRRSRHQRLHVGHVRDEPYFARDVGVFRIGEDECELFSLGLKSTGKTHRRSASWRGIRASVERSTSDLASFSVETK